MSIRMVDDIADINRWMAGEDINNVQFNLNDFVTIISGEFEGGTGSVISPEEFGNNPTYLIETSAGKDILVKQNELRKYS